MTTTGDFPTMFTPYVAVSAEGQRIGLMSCNICGATVLVSTVADAANLHEEWHRSIEGWYPE